MSNAKTEYLEGFCQCCLSELNLISMLQNDGSEDYTEMLSYCFSVDIIKNGENNDVLYLICESCIPKLKSATAFRNQIEEVQTKLRCSTIFADSTVDDTLSDVFVKDEDVLDDSWNSDSSLHSESDSSLYRSKNITIIKFEPKSDESESNFHSRRSDKNNSTKKLISSKFDYIKSIVKSDSFDSDDTSPRKNPQTFVCDFCGKQFSKLRILQNHFNSHNTVQVTCKVCNKLVKQKNMVNHMRTHTVKEGFGCPHCPERFTSMSRQLKHLADVHELERKRYHCHLCTKHYSLPHHRSAHIRKCHLQERNYVCTECGKGYFRKSALLEHTMRHKGEGMYHCDVCYKPFYKKYHLQRHLRTHEINVSYNEMT